MRRLPVYFLIDVSESMAGVPLQEVETGINEIIRELRSDPYALETVFLSVIVFAGKAEILAPLIELTCFKLPKLPIGSGTSLGVGLDFLMKDLDRSVRKTTLETKGDWKPVVFLFTDGAPTDDPAKAVRKWNKEWRGRCNLIAVSLGDNADVKLLSQLTDTALRLVDLDEISFKSFFQWISASIKQSSISVNEQGQDGLRLPPAHGINLEKINKDSTFSVDENFVVLAGKCSKTKQLYLLKYAKMDDPEAGYEFVGAFPLDSFAYERLSEKSRAKKQTIDSRNLKGDAPCPCCGNIYSMIHCGACNQISCAGEDLKFLCGWCGNSGLITLVDNLDYGREKG